MSTRQKSLTVHEVLIALGQSQGLPKNLTLTSAPLLAALKKVGTRHIYADTASQEELKKFLTVDQKTILAEVDGNTVKPAADGQGHQPVFRTGQPSRMGTAASRTRERALATGVPPVALQHCLRARIGLGVGMGLDP